MKILNPRKNIYFAIIEHSPITILYLYIQIIVAILFLVHILFYKLCTREKLPPIKMISIYPPLYLFPILSLLLSTFYCPR